MRVIILVFCCFCTFALQAVALTKQEELQEIDVQIQELKEKKRGYEGAALRHEDYADRQQFQDRVFLESRRHLQLAEENREKAQAIQQEIDELQLQRTKILNLEK